MSKLHLAWCSHKAAKYACENWHYSGCVPKSKLVKVGVWEDDCFIGVVIFAYGATAKLVNPYGLTMQQGCELVRVALKEHKAPVTKIVSIAIKLLKKHSPNLELIVSFADPQQEHVGTIYQAGNWIYAGRSQATEEYVVNGKRWHGRSLRNTKPKNMTTKEYAASLDANFQVIQGSSKYRYLYPLTERMRKKIASLSQPYPKPVRHEHEGNAP